MSFVSYAQNFEDVMLWRALKHVEKGFYVDVGAQHPVIDSVSKAFYERGWRGVHIEPVPEYAELLRKDRPDETVLQIALGDTEGTLELNVIPNTGLSTAVDAYAQRHQLDRGYEHQRIEVPVLTLNSALRSMAGKDIHWLKIDVEGFEEKVLRGWDSQTLRPWIIVVEATIPNLPDTDCGSWDPILSAAEYQFVYFDGLNRFYVSKEHAELAEAFSSPPNVFDDVVLTASSYLNRGLMTSHQEREKELVIRAENLSTELHAANEHTGRLQAHVQWVQNERDAAKQRVEELSQRTGRLEGELELERQRIVQLGADLKAAREHEGQLQAQAEWLQNEWDAAKAKIDELNQSSHHWWTVAEQRWTVAEQLKQELQGVYASKSWRVTVPLRVVNRWRRLFLKAVSSLIFSFVRRSSSILRRAGLRMASEPWLRRRAQRILQRLPAIHERTRQFLRFKPVTILNNAQRRRFASAATGIPPVFVDVTFGLMNKLRSGLQRVEREIAAGLRELDPGSQYFIFVAWNSESRRFHLVLLDHLIEREKLPPFQSWLASCPPVDFNEGADLFILGSNWPLGESYHDDVVALALKGLRVSVLIPDLIPIRHRRDFYSDSPDGATFDLFKVFCIKVLPVCSNVLTISNYVRTDIEKFFEEIGLEASEKKHVPKLYVLKLGADWSAPIVDSPNTALPKTGPIKNTYILCVSTLEKRKNHKRLLEAMRRVREQIKDLDLVLVGRSDTSMEETTLECIRESAWVHHFDVVDDSTLRRLYEESLFTVYPSLDEGYGLPVIESFKHRKFCLASYAGAIPEAGGEWADYFDPEDVQDLAAKIFNYVANREELRRRETLLASYKPASWRETSWQVAGVFHGDRAKDMFMTDDMHERARPRMQEPGRRKAAVSQHEGLDIANEASFQIFFAQSELDEIMDKLRHRIVKELDLFVAARESKPRNQLELRLIAEGLRYDCGIYDVNALRRVPEEEFFEALSVLLFKRPLEENRPLSAVKQISRRRLIILWMCSLLPGRRARIVGLYRQLLRSALSKSPLGFSLVKRVYYWIT